MDVKIVDTGINVNNPSVVESVKANDGNEIILISATIRFNQTAIINAPSFPAYVGDDQNDKYKSAPIKTNGINAAVITIDFYVYKSDTTTLQAIGDLLRTKGKKRLYCDLAQIRGMDYFEGVVSRLSIDDSSAEATNVYICRLEFTELM